SVRGEGCARAPVLAIRFLTVRTRLNVIRHSDRNEHALAEQVNVVLCRLPEPQLTVYVVVVRLMYRETVTRSRAVLGNRAQKVRQHLLVVLDLNRDVSGLLVYNFEELRCDNYDVGRTELSRFGNV